MQVETTLVVTLGLRLVKKRHEGEEDHCVWERKSEIAGVNFTLQSKVSDTKKVQYIKPYICIVESHHKAAREPALKSTLIVGSYM